jgi:hypothetical protein
MSRIRNFTLLLTVLLCLAGRGFAATAIGSVTITGGEQSSGGTWDNGTVTATVNGSSVTFAYGQFSTPAQIASALGALISNSCGFPVYAQASGTTLTFYQRGSNSISSASITSTSNNPSLFPGNSFSVNLGNTWNIPLVTGVSLPQGPPGMGLVITGNGFTANSQVWVGGLLGGSPATIIGTPTSTQITVQVPNNVASSGIVVVVNGFSSNTFSSFQVVNAFGCN